MMNKVSLDLYEHGMEYCCWDVIIGVLIVGLGILNVSSSINNPSQILDKLLFNNIKIKNMSLSTEQIMERMASVTVHTMSDDAGRYCSVNLEHKHKSVEFLFLDKLDAEDYMHLYAGRYGDLHITELPLSQIIIEETTPHSQRRLVPELSQVKNALSLRGSWLLFGVPVFKTDICTCTVTWKKPYEQVVPLLLRKDDLVRSVSAVNEAPAEYDIQVFSLEAIIKSMQDSSTSKWNDAVFVAPGLTYCVWESRKDNVP